MDRTRERYVNYILFNNSKEKDPLPQKIFWVAIFSSFLVIGLSREICLSVILRVLKYTPLQAISTFFPHGEDLQKVSYKILNNVVIPMKGFIFFVSFLVIAYPIIKCLWQSRSFWQRLEVKKIVLHSLFLALFLAILIFPYSYPYGLNTHASGLSLNGVLYGRMTLNPFAQNLSFFSTRLLLPAIAHFIQLKGYPLYYLLSLVLTYILIFMTLIFFEAKFLHARHLKENEGLNLKIRFWIYLSVMTTSYMMTNFLWPGYIDQLSFILILLMASLPMTAQARLGSVTLCMLNHEASAFALIPIIVFCFPKEERKMAFCVIALFFVVLFASFKFDLYNLFQKHFFVVEKVSTFTYNLKKPEIILLGAFFSYKFFWILLFYVLWLLWSWKDKRTLLAIAGMVFFPFLMLLLAWDTTRLIGFGFLGMLITLVIFIQEHKKIPKNIYYIFLILIYANILLPFCSLVSGPKPLGVAKYPYLGLYRLIHNFLYRLKTLVFYKGCIP